MVLRWLFSVSSCHIYGWFNILSSHNIKDTDGHFLGIPDKQSSIVVALITCKLVPQCYRYSLKKTKSMHKSFIVLPVSCNPLDSKVTCISAYFNLTWKDKYECLINQCMHSYSVPRLDSIMMLFAKGATPGAWYREWDVLCSDVWL